MKRMTVIGVAAIVLTAMPVLAEEVDRTLDAAADGHVHVSNIAGSVTVRGWSRDQVHVTGELGRNVEELIVERSGDKITIKVKVPRNSGRGIDSDLHIEVPAGSSLDVGTVSADIDVIDVRGDQKLNTVSGDIDTEGGTADISAQAVSGDIEINGQGQDAEINANSVSGDVVLVRVGGTASAETVSGDVSIEAGVFNRARLNTVNGDIEFNSALSDGGKLSVETVNGDVDLQFDGEVSGRFDIDTFNGNIRNCFGPKAERTSKYTPGWELSFQEGDGRARVEVSTLNGDVVICR